MICAFCLEHVETHTSFSRQQLFKEVFEYRTAGCLKKVWCSAGHVFISLSGLKKFITFDAKPLDDIPESEHSGCLDLEDEVLKIIFKPPASVLVVQTDGLIQYWSYGSDNKWIYLAKCNLPTSPSVTVSDVCFNISQNALYWCEEEVLENGKCICSIYKRQLTEVEDRNVLKLGPVSVLLTGCTNCQLYPTGHGVTCVLRGKSGQVSVAFSLHTLTGHVQLFVDDKLVTLQDLSVHSTITFKQLLLKSIQYMSELKENVILRSSYIPQHQMVILLYVTGRLAVLKPTADTAVKVVDLQNFDSTALIDVCFQYGHICLIYPGYLRFYSKTTGELICELEMPEPGVMYEGCSELLLSGLQNCIYTEDQVYHIKKTQVENHSAEMSLLQHGRFQTDAIRLSYINKMQKLAVGSTQSIDTYREKWLEDIQLPPSSKLVETVEPYLKEFWRLDSFLRKGLENPQAISELPKCTVEAEVTQLLDPKSPQSQNSRYTQLQLLSQQFPEVVLDCLLRHLEITEEELSTSQKQRWQCAVAMETSTGGSSSDQALPVFDLMCHLLYKYKPEKLLPFLLCAQRVCDQKVGVSAFSRRRHAPQMFERAVHCFPQPDCSVDLETAIQAHAHVLLTCDSPDCVLSVTELLVRYRQWLQCLDLLQKYQGHSPQFSLMYQIVLSALTKHELLSQYGERLFALMPSFISCDDVIQKTKENIGSVTEQNILCSTDDLYSVTVDMIRPHLLSHLKQQ